MQNVNYCFRFLVAVTRLLRANPALAFSLHSLRSVTFTLVILPTIIIPQVAVGEDPHVAIARDAARADPRVKSMLQNGKAQVHRVELASSPVAGPRTVTLILFSPSTKVGISVSVVVELGKGNVREPRQVSLGQVPLSDDERKEAWKLLSTQESRQKLKKLGGKLEDYQLMYSPFESIIETDPCKSNRCLAVSFRQGAHFMGRLAVVVDLSAQDVLISEDAH